MTNRPSNGGAASNSEQLRFAGITMAMIARIGWIGPIGLGGLTLAGWCLRIPALRSGWPSAPQMTVNGALIFVLLGMALGLMVEGERVAPPAIWR